MKFIVNDNKYISQLKNTDKLWVGIDLDNTLAESIWTPESREGIGKPLSGALEGIQKLIDLGFKPVLYTARPWSDHEAIERWLSDHQFPIKRIICGKPLFRKIIDDVNIEFDGDWDKALKKL
jgi:hypothetical protein